MKKSLIWGVLFLLASCNNLSISTNGDSLSNKLQNTEWSSEGFFRKKHIQFFQDQIKLKSGSVLGAESSYFTILDQNSNYVVYRIYEDKIPAFVGIVQLDQQTIQMVLWQHNLNVTSVDELLEIIRTQGTVFKLRKQSKNFV
ncbi:MAG: hypothetical protein ACRCWI_00215 [Brevinema sp.]